MKTFIAKENMWLTQNGEVADNERYYTKEIYAPDNVSDDAFRDATGEEKEAWEARMDAIIEEEEEEYENDQWDDIN